MSTDRRRERWRDGRRRPRAASATGAPDLTPVIRLERPLCLATQCGIVCRYPQRLPGRLCLRSDATQSSGREDPHIEVFILQSGDQLRHGRLRRRADAGEGLARRPSNAGNGSARAWASALVALAALRADGRQGLRRVDADVGILVRQSVDESAYRRAGSLAQSAQGSCGIARDDRILVSQRPSQRRLNPFGVGHQVNQCVDGAAPERVSLIPQKVHQQWNGRRTDPLDDLKRLPHAGLHAQGRGIASAKGSNASPLGPGRSRRRRGPSRRWPAADLPSHLRGRDYWRAATRSGAAVIGTARPLG